MKTVQDLRSIQSQAILRLNCPGYGQASALSKGGAHVLTDYRAIIVNPLSILHLFDEQSNLTKQIDIAINDGVTSFKLPDDELINKLCVDIDARSQEMLQFLAQGGLLVYYLCRPFVLSGKSRFLDNYAWLCGLAPDQSGQSTISEQTIRHMSTVAHGRNIDKTEHAENSEFSKYFDQSGLEWNTIIRSEFLTEGYSPLALAGPKKCIAAQLMVGDSGGQVVFLPSPYSPDFDRTLVDCIYQWHNNHLEEDSILPELEQKIPQVSVPEVPPPQIEPIAPGNNIQLAPQMKPFAQQNNLQPAPKHARLKGLFAEQSAPALDEPPAPAGNANGQEPEKSPGHSTPKQVLEELKQSLPPTASQTNPVQTGVYKSLPGPELSEERKQSPPPAINQTSPVATGVFKSLPELDETLKDNWSTNYSLLGIENISDEVEAVQAQIMQLKKQIANKQETIGFLEAVKVPLLSGRGGSLIEACKVTINVLGWTSKSWGTKLNELLINENGQPVALARISISEAQAERSELARLAESMINYWNEHTGEPKGIFVVCSFADTPFEQRQEADFSKMEIEFAQHKNICLLSTLQLLYIYRDIRLGKVDMKTVRQNILTCNGCLPGFTN